MMKKAPFRSIEGEGEDSCTERGWIMAAWLKEKHSPSLCRTKGYLIDEDKKRIVVSHSIGADGHDAIDAIAIPKAVIKKRRWLKD